MEQLSFQDITEQCYDLLSNIRDSSIKELYWKFSFFYIEPNLDIQNDPHFKKLLIQTLRKHKFFTYKYENKIHEYKLFSRNEEKMYNNVSNNNVDVVFCAEESYFIIEQINIKLVDEIINRTNSSSINLNLTKNLSIAYDEVNEFCKYFEKIINSNKFIQCTIWPIVGFIIRRFYYPSSFFNDKSFFRFNMKENNDISFKIDQSIDKMIYDLFNAIDENDFKNIIKNFQKCISKEKSSQPNIIHFKENEFIKLRRIYSNGKSQINLVIHIKSFYLFAVKYFNFSKDDTDHEINFVKNFSHRCFNKFHGFLKDNDGKFTGVVYEFNSNGSLEDLFQKTQKINNIFLLTTMIRIFNGIQYLQSNNLIHRDLKPDNILINHDFIPFISDYETIRKPETDTSDSFFTNDIGSQIYMSPEQYNGDIVSFPTDIYSFGYIIYFLFEKKEPANISIKIISKNVPLIENVSPNIQDIYLSCVKINPVERINLDNIENKIKQEINSYSYIEQYLIEVFNSINNELIHYFHENILFLEVAKFSKNLYFALILIIYI